VIAHILRNIRGIASFSSHADENPSLYDLSRRSLSGARMGAGSPFAGNATPANCASQSSAPVAELRADAGSAQRWHDRATRFDDRPK